MATTRRLNPDSAAGNARLAAKAVSPIAQAQRVSTTRAAIRANNPAGSAGRAATMAADITSGRARVADPFGVDFGFALPVGKLISAAKNLRLAGRSAEALALEARVAAKKAGKFFGGSEEGFPMHRSVDVGGPARKASESLFPTKGSPWKWNEKAQGYRRASEGSYPRLPSSKGWDSPKLGRGGKDLRSFDIYSDPYNMGNERVMGGAVRTASGSLAEATMPRIASRLPKPKLPKSGPRAK